MLREKKVNTARTSALEDDSGLEANQIKNTFVVVGGKVQVSLHKKSRHVFIVFAIEHVLALFN